MFYKASLFNKLLNEWNVGKVKSMRLTFSHTSSFNKSLNNWNISNVTDMRWMFHDARNFDISLNDWNISILKTWQVCLMDYQLLNYLKWFKKKTSNNLNIYLLLF